MLRSLACHTSLAHTEVPTLVQAFCDLVPIVQAFKVTCEQVHEGVELAQTLAHTLRSIWDTLDDMFPYWRFCDIVMSLLVSSIMCFPTAV